MFKFNRNNEEKLVLKQMEKERIRHHKEMVEQERAHAQEEKIAPEGAFISLKHINKIYDNHVQAVYDFNLDIKEKEFIVFVGPSGCGKSTTLRMIAGLEDITAGDLYIDKEYMNAIPAKDRNISMVFQNYALYPHLTIYENMAFSLKVRHLNKQEIDRRIQEASEILQIKEYLGRKPNALSGGQCQRVALGRAIVRDCKLFLMDEPLSNLDAKLRVSMRSEIIKLHNRLDATTIYVTHDQTEAMTMASRIVVMNKGYIQQIGTPQEIYNHPANTFVASFIGSPSMNLLNATTDFEALDFGSYAISLDENRRKALRAFYENGLADAKDEFKSIEENDQERNELHDRLSVLREKDSQDEKEKRADEAEIAKIESQINIIEKANERRTELLEIIAEYEKILESGKADVIFGIRPDDIHKTSDLTDKVNPSSPLTLSVSVAELLGNTYYLYCDFFGEEIIVSAPAETQIQSGDQVELTFNLNKYHLFDKVTKRIIE